MVEHLMKWAERACDQVCDLRSYPEASENRRPRVIAHRGAWGPHYPENTLGAFREARRVGADGIEFDVHFTRDDVPVVHHDEDLMRFFGRSEKLAQLTQVELKNIAPTVPTLEEVLALPDLHFMIELKTELSARQIQILKEKLRHRRPVEDYHFLVIEPEKLRVDLDWPGPAWILVGELNLAPKVAIATQKALGGVAGHYLGMTNGLIAKLHAHGQLAGAGFIPTANLLRRERGRGLDFAFTNRAADLEPG